MLERIFYFWLENSLTGERKVNPIITDQFLGDVGEAIMIDGVGYIIKDWAVEAHVWSE
jgi:hypothetical protein